MSTQRTLSERDETYVGDIVRDENWLVNSSCTLPPNTITFHATNKEVLRITHDGRLVTGEGLSADEATREAAKLLIASFEEQIQKMVDARIAAEREKVRVLREALQAIRALNPTNMCGDHWGRNMGLEPDDVFDLCDAALAAMKEETK